MEWVRQRMHNLSHLDCHNRRSRPRAEVQPCRCGLSSILEKRCVWIVCLVCVSGLCVWIWTDVSTKETCGTVLDDH